jgi:hypothetical protein
LTQDDLKKIPSSYRSYMGSGYPVWKVTELAQYANEKNRIEKEVKEKALIEEYGVEVGRLVGI